MSKRNGNAERIQHEIRVRLRLVLYFEIERERDSRRQQKVVALPGDVLYLPDLLPYLCAAFES